MITILNEKANSFPLNAKDLKDGHSYVCKDGILYICNKVGDVIAWSVNGKYIIYESNSQSVFREVDITIAIDD